jgi:hypothetical protein
LTSETFAYRKAKLPFKTHEEYLDLKNSDQLVDPLIVRFPFLFLKSKYSSII